ncbi:hypothetical protein RYH73_21615 [Olivibacter sp. CPCC 100613]|uniref:hypothetical protein n=1 Tax=Olivibacter sp. CPCC 100613 TaxID=3079931 RepID=UPI002FF7176E
MAKFIQLTLKNDEKTIINLNTDSISVYFDEQIGSNRYAKIEFVFSHLNPIYVIETADEVKKKIEMEGQ